MLSGLKLIVTYNRIIGNTFFGWTDDQENKHKWKPILLKFWNVILLIILTLPLLFIGFGCVNMAERDGLPNNITNQENLSDKFNLPNFLYMVSGINYSVQSLVLALYLALIGPKLMSVLAEEKTYDLDIDEGSEYRTAKSIIIIQVCIIMIPMTMNLLTEFIFRTTSPIMIIISLIHFPSMSMLTNFLVLIAYKSFTVKHEFKKFQERKVSLVETYNVLCNIERSICKMDQYVSIYILWDLLFNSLFCVSAICHLALNLGTNIRFMETIMTFNFGFINFSLLCYLCNVIPANLTNLISKVEHDLSTNSYDSESRQILIQMREMNTRIGFTGFGFFRVNSNTFLTCLAQIISYSIIIIQTGSQDTSHSTPNIANCTCLCLAYNCSLT